MNPSLDPATTNDLAVVNIAAYQFVELTDLERRRTEMRLVVDRCDLRGTVLLSPEGINMFLAGGRLQVDEYLAWLREDPAFRDIEVKESLSSEQPFNRMLIKIKSEIIAFGVPGVDPLQKTSPKLPATELRKWLDEGRKVHLFDTRNDFEIEVGTFAQAIPAGIDNFRDFPEAVSRLPHEMKHEPVVMFCTGGIRCEKAGPYMEQAGFQQIYQLDGGILKYFEECGGAHYEGDCFVFDKRVALDPALQETGHTQCYICQEVVSPEAQLDPRYVAEVSCPRCYREPEEQLAQRLQERKRALAEIVTPLPGSQPYFNRRPLNVPQRFDGFGLLDFLCEWHPQIPRDEWQQKISASEIVPRPHSGRRRKPASEEKLPLAPDRIVRAGQRYVTLLPGTVEPDVSANIEIVFEDEQFIVVDKPAPLPLHPSGRFNRNTLQYIVGKLYDSESPLIAHRLDANTSGVLVLCRTRAIARVVQPQFERRTVRKQYLARIHGTPAEPKFGCTAPIAPKPGDSGIRFVDSANGQEAHTEFETLCQFGDDTTLVAVTPLTGRTNQIRLHLWHLGHPIVGDPAYLPGGGIGANRTLSVDEDPMCLHASEISLHDQNGELRRFAAPNPAWAAE